MPQEELLRMLAPPEALGPDDFERSLIEALPFLSAQPAGVVRSRKKPEQPNNKKAACPPS